MRLMNVFGDRARHTILSAMPDQMSARDAIGPSVAVEFPADAPPLYGKPAPGRYRRLARYMQGFDLILSYNWGSMDAVMAHRLASSFMALPPLIHHEDGFNQDEAVRLNWKRNGFRRLGLGSARALVVPSLRLERIAKDIWGGGAKVERISNGIPVNDYLKPPAPDAIPGFAKRDGQVVVGTIAGLRAVKNLPRLVRALPAGTQLVIVGEGPEREAILAEAKRLGIEGNVHLPGFMANPASYAGLFDIFALSSDSEQFPISLVEGMAAGLPVAATDVGDIKAMVAEPNMRFIAPDEAGLRAALAELAADPALRRSLGDANRAKAMSEYDEGAMVSRYEKLYFGAVAAHRL